MQSRITIDGYTFKYDESSKTYECRGDVCYNDDHDEIPEEGLWDAGVELEKRLTDEGHNASVDHSEKGWVEVQIF